MSGHTDGHRADCRYLCQGRAAHPGLAGAMRASVNPERVVSTDAVALIQPFQGLPKPPIEPLTQGALRDPGVCDPTPTGPFKLALGKGIRPSSSLLPEQVPLQDLRIIAAAEQEPAVRREQERWHAPCQMAAQLQPFLPGR